MCCDERPKSGKTSDIEWAEPVVENMCVGNRGRRRKTKEKNIVGEDFVFLECARSSLLATSSSRATASPSIKFVYLTWHVFPTLVGTRGHLSPVPKVVTDPVVRMRIGKTRKKKTRFLRFEQIFTRSVMWAGPAAAAPFSTLRTVHPVIFSSRTCSSTDVFSQERDAARSLTEYSQEIVKLAATTDT